MLKKKKYPKNVINYNPKMVARGRFELPSEGPEPSMIDRYTTGLSICYRKVSLLPNKSLICHF
jgi:hypothetical protein